MGLMSPANVDKLRSLFDQVVKGWRLKSAKQSHVPIRMLVTVGLMEDGNVWVMTVGDNALPIPPEAAQLSILGSACGIAAATMVDAAIQRSMSNNVEPEPPIS